MDGFKCWHCGKLVDYDGEPQVRVYCEQCEQVVIDERNRILSEHIDRKIRVMHERALREMERGGVYMHEYVDIARDTLAAALKNPEKYLSSDEMICAMVLDSNGYEYEINKRIGKYVVDFYIPELKVILEVDGERHEFKADSDSRRDLELKKALGDSWEVVRIPTKYVEENPEALPDALVKVRDYKRKLRKQYGGYLPEGYSKREQELYKNIREYNERRLYKV